MTLTTKRDDSLLQKHTPLEYLTKMRLDEIKWSDLNHQGIVLSWGSIQAKVLAVKGKTSTFVLKCTSRKRSRRDEELVYDYTVLNPRRALVEVSSFLIGHSIVWGLDIVSLTNRSSLEKISKTIKNTSLLQLLHRIS